MRATVSKKVIRGWLENYHALQSGDRSEVPTNSGPKEYDGVSGAMLNKIMLDTAITTLPPLARDCVVYRWLLRLPLAQTLQATGLSRTKYYRQCDLAIMLIYRELNNIAVNYQELTRALDK